MSKLWKEIERMFGEHENSQMTLTELKYNVRDQILGETTPSPEVAKPLKK